MGYFQHLNFHFIVDTLFQRSECGAYATMMATAAKHHFKTEFALFQISS